MRSRRAVSVLLLSLLVGCEGCGSDAEEPASGGDNAGGTVASGGESPSEEADPGPAPDVRLRAETDRYGRLTVAVENRGREPARLAASVAVEREGGAGFHESDRELVLAPDCERSAAEGAGSESCVTLVPGAVLYPCECGGCDEIPAGSHRFSAQTCGGTHTLASAPIVLDR